MHWWTPVLITQEVEKHHTPQIQHGRGVGDYITCWQSTVSEMFDASSTP